MKEASTKLQFYATSPFKLNFTFMSPTRFFFFTHIIKSKSRDVEVVVGLNRNSISVSYSITREKVVVVPKAARKMVIMSKKQENEKDINVRNFV